MLAIHVNPEREKDRNGILLREAIRRKLRAVPAARRQDWNEAELLRWWVLTRASPEILELGGDDLEFKAVRSIALGAAQWLREPLAQL